MLKKGAVGFSQINLNQAVVVVGFGGKENVEAWDNAQPVEQKQPKEETIQATNDGNKCGKSEASYCREEE